jgi:intraflagellar transport protein 43
MWLISRVEKKFNIWEKAGEADDIQYIPDAEEENKP